VRESAHLGLALALGAVVAVVGVVSQGPLGSHARAAEVVSGGFSLQLLAYEGFDYAAGPLVPGNGGTGWTAAWSKSYGPGGDYQVIATGLTYPGLDVTGGAIEWGFGGNQVNGARRTLDRVHDGVVYIQALTHYTAQTGGGTPNLRFSDDSTGSFVQTFGVGGNGAADMAVLDPIHLQPLASSGVSMNQLLLTIVRIDYAANETSMWVNPDLSTFDYASPPVADGVAAGFAPTFSAIDPFTRIGSRVDELRVMRLVAPPPVPPAPPRPAEPPTDVMATAGDRSAVVTWSVPVMAGSYPITHYLVTSAPDRRLCLATATECTVTGLTNGTPYVFTVQALTGAGWSVASSPSAEVTPSAPTRPTITITGVREGKRISVSGVTTGISAGVILRPWIRFVDQSEALPGVAQIEVSSEGSFEWGRRVGRPVEVYVQTPDGAVRSNLLRYG